MTTLYTYATEALPLAALIDLDQVVAVKPNGDGTRLIVQFHNARGLMLPFDATARDALVAAWAEGRAVFAYQFSDPDRDDVVVAYAWIRADKVKAITQHHLDPAYVQIRTTAPSSMIVPFHAQTMQAFAQYVTAQN